MRIFLLLLTICLFHPGAGYAAGNIAEKLARAHNLPGSQYMGYIYEFGKGPLKIEHADGEKEVLLGKPGDLPADALACIRKAGKEYKQLRLTGTFKDDGKAVKLADPKSLKCSIIGGEEDCPDIPLEKRSDTGTYGGMEYGDFGHLIFKPDNGPEYDVLADGEKVEKLFGTKPGKRVQIDYVVEQFWIPFGGGSCAVGSTFTDGRVISSK